MIFKGLGGKVFRFIQGRMTALWESDSGRAISPSCLYFYPSNSSDVPLAQPLIVFYSGDGGWANLTTQLSKELQKAGYPVVGIDCMHYFWKEKESAVAARELSKLIEDQSALWGTSRVVLLGYSMGADVLPLITRQLPKEIFDRVKSMILISPSHRVQLKFRFLGWLGFETPEKAGSSLLPDLELLTDLFPISCFAGDKETDCFASTLAAHIAHTQILPGGHHYGGDYQKLAECLIGEVSRDVKL